MTSPFAHLTALHISESLKDTLEEADAEPELTLDSAVVRVDHPSMPVIRVTVSPATHPLTSLAVPNATQTLEDADVDVTFRRTESSTRDSMPGSVMTYRVPRSSAAAVTEEIGLHTVALSSPSATKAIARRPKTGAITPLMIRA